MTLAPDSQNADATALGKGISTLAPRESSAVGFLGLSESRAHQRLRLDVERATIALDAEAVVALLRVKAHLSGMGADGVKFGLDVLAAGFGGGIRHPQRESFGAFCMRHDATEVLTEVLRSDLASPVKLLTAVCSWRHVVAGKKSKSRKADARTSAARPEFKTQSLWASSFSRNSADGIRVAFEFDADNPALHGAVKTSFMDLGNTLHAQALGLALHYLCSGKFWAVKSSLAILQVFREYKTPVLRADTSNCLLDSFVTTDCPAEYHDAFRELFHAYVSAGYVDPNLRLTGGAAHKRVSGLLPLSGAILLRNRAVAVELVLAGADFTAVGNDVNMPGMGAMDLARARKPQAFDSKQPTQEQLEEAEAFAAELAAAVMERTISCSAGPAPSVHAESTRSRRQSRAL